MIFMSTFQLVPLFFGILFDSFCFSSSNRFSFSSVLVSISFFVVAGFALIPVNCLYFFLLLFGILAHEFFLISYTHIRTMKSACLYCSLTSFIYGARRTTRSFASSKLVHHFARGSTARRVFFTEQVVSLCL